MAPVLHHYKPVIKDEYVHGKKSARLAQTHHAISCLMGLKLNTEMHTEHTAELVPHQRD